MEFAVETRGLARTFRSLRAVDGIDLQVPTGSFYGFLGPNGAGKSTTIKCLTGLLRPSGGEMRILGIDPIADPVSVKRRIGVVPEDLALFERLTASEMLMFIGQVHGMADETFKSRSADLLSLMDLNSAATTLVADFSHGMRKKLALAAALLPISTGSDMTRIFRAFLWLRWRVLVNSLERTGARDTIERFSLATEKLGPIMALVLLVPSSFALAALGLIAGHGTATGEWLLPMALVRYFLLASTAFTLIGPIILPMRDGGNAIRFLLLPIPRLALYMAHVTAALADPWVLLTMPPLATIPIGLAAGGRLLSAASALIAGTAFLLIIIGLTSLISSAIHLLLRDRRRSDLVMLFLVVALPMLGLVPTIVTAQRASERIAEKSAGRRPSPHAPAVMEIAARRAYAYLPSELYTKVATAGTGTRRSVVFPLAGLAAIAFAVQALGFGAFKRMLDMPQSLGARRAGAFGGLWSRRIPGLTPAASAVALAHVRLAMRTPRGRSMLAAPLLMLLVFGFLIRRTGEMPFVGVRIDTGLSLATFMAFISVLSIL